MSFIVDDLLMFPIDLSMKVLTKIRDMADEQMLNTQESVQKKFMEIQMKYENGELEEKEYKEVVEFLENRLKKIRGEK
ncbi:MAG: hypothetical protein COS08_04970 [Euryarchaeota archaeon CG01_land_8_20_14_3_00_38_12]|nr:MAG: hypothetical protein COS08_04970 [Euryarchaeota archaeon CG01_land_8_20_14_3_00_38_12]PJB21292.1 MAG: hypothetical protein CO114_06085 [Euryarchaeota archaeon CG_4_9_14_3_um_filter_38_12]